MNLAKTHLGREALAFGIGFGVTLILLFLLALSHRFLTRRSEEQAMFSLHSAGTSQSADMSSSQGGAVAQSSFQRELRDLTQSTSVDTEAVFREPLTASPSMDSFSLKSVNFGESRPFQDAAFSGVPSGSGKLREGPPQMLFAPKASFPEELIRAGITKGSALFHVRISETGDCEIISIERISHPDLREIMLMAVEESIFQIPRRNGAVEAGEYLFPVDFEADPERVKMIQANIEMK